MTEYSKDELQRLIRQYQQQMVSEYANNENQSTSPAPDTTISPVKSEDPDALTDIGQLQIRVSTENQAYPIVGAVVTVTHSHHNDRVLDRILITDQNGLTDIIDLATKDRRLSLSPGNTEPYTVYDIRVNADGYFTKEFLNQPIYGGVTAIQSVGMIPLPEGGDRDIPIIIDTFQ